MKFRSTSDTVYWFLFVFCRCKRKLTNFDRHSKLAIEQDRRLRLAAELAVDLLSFSHSLFFPAVQNSKFRKCIRLRSRLCSPCLSKFVKTGQETQRDLHFA